MPDLAIPDPRVAVSITRDAIDETAHLNFCRDDFAGAVSVFVGTTRNTFNGARVLKLSYECYETMALAELRRIAGEMIEKFKGDGDESTVGARGRGGHGVRAVSIEHRLGDVGVGETSVVIVASASHRRDASDATAYGIEALKARVPIWKKETFVVEDDEGGDREASVWKENNLGVFAKK